MASKDLEKVLNQSIIVEDHDVEFDEKSDTYMIDVEITSMRDDSDLSEFLKLKNKLRASVNMAYRIKINFSMTI